MEQSRKPYSVEEVCTLLGVSDKFVWRLCRQGKLPAVQIGRKWYIKRPELDQMLGIADPEQSTPGRMKRNPKSALSAQAIW